MDLTIKAEHINGILQKYLPQKPYLEGGIEDAMEYSVMSGGKRLRGIMLLEAFRLYCSDKELEKMLAEPFAAAMEFVHAYSLVHDDLPSMDNDMYRRGKLTTHAKYGHAMGVLTGDALLNYAFETMSAAITEVPEFDAAVQAELSKRICRAISSIGTKAGYSGMIGGQVMDVCNIDCAEKTVEEKLSRLYKLYELKTSRLFQAALSAGAILGGADDEQTSVMEKIGYDIGIAFQIKDDILDSTATFEELGKDIGSDSKNNKETVSTLVGIEEAELLSEKYLKSAVEYINRLPGNKEFFVELTEFLKVRKK